ncbi:putative wall-associated receptor kinase, galacturonan-binding domain-containing protein [Helianthus annuus]|uniref:Wall-associated receptor kinase, galacturonan-binding domain-containing protein n=1 Tax=Helianthus annuus TaxID=4232 RepID=A0A251UHV8_HELAN|nr:putative RING-H2 finger protein ATL21A [Helianthus annuus]KAF5801344.1 putative wall-associated receptor kinase, galacturonan-binding domain-containing protein [Helianthus annuus]KAJ0572636.1 putative wall-associated receptor kinase, galacturonan-binding domain-containing protein [Helianthus annuus]
MDHDLKVLLYLLILLHVLSPSLAASPYNCPVSFCGSTAFSIQFPFREVGQQQDMCGYPGFNLRCDKQGKLLLNLPNSGDFSVRAIDYRSQVIQVYDPSGCSAARRLTLDLSGSPFWGTPSKNYTLLSCPVEDDMSNHTSVGCISNSTHSTLAISSQRFAMTMANQTACRIIGSITTPIAWWQDQGGLTSNLDIDLALTWDDPNCRECATRGGICGYTNTTKQDITCFDNTKKGNKHHIIGLVIIAIALPATAASIALVCYICKDRRRVATCVARNATPSTPDTTTVSNGDTVIGLDQSTIKSDHKSGMCSPGARVMN